MDILIFFITVAVLPIAIVAALWSIFYLIFKFLLKKNIRPFHKLPIGALLGLSLVAALFLALISEPFFAPRSKARDAKRMADMRQLVKIQKEYRSKGGHYFTADKMPNMIGNYAISVDPKTQIPYFFILNKDKPDNFCYFAELENKYPNKYSYYTASDQGNFYRLVAPRTFQECGSQD